MQDQATRLALAGIGLLDGKVDLLYVVAVRNVDHIPAERVKLRADAFAMAHDFLDRTVQLAAVVIHKAHEVVQLIVRGELCALPDLAFVCLAVTDGDEHMVVASLHAAA